MPPVFDKRIPANDHDPLANLLNFNDIDLAVEQAGDAIRAFIFGSLDGVVEVIKTLTGIDLSSWVDFLEGLTGEIGLSLPDLADLNPITFLGNLGTFLSYDFTSPDFDPLAAAEDFIDFVLAPVGKLLGFDSPLDASNLFGLLLPNLFSNVPVGAITDQQPNLLVSGGFSSLASIYDNAKFSWDSTVTRTADGTGSARTTANGTLRALRSNLAAVSADQKLDVSTWVKTASLVTTGSAFHLDVVKFSGTVNSPTQIGTQRLATLSPGSGSHDWAQMAGTYTVPAGTTCVCLRLVVDPLATAGTVWFDDAVLKQTGLLQMGWIGGLLEQFTSIFSVFGSGGSLTELQDAWQNLLGLLRIDLPDDLLGDLDFGGIWQGIAEDRLDPLGFFANLIGGQLPNSQKPPWLQDLTDGIGNLFTGSTNTNLAVPNALTSLTNIWGTGQTAQASADNANIGVQIIKARLEAPGVVGYDEFDYSNANTLPGDRYALSESGPGAGQYGPNGAGQLVWKPSGFAAREKVYKRTDVVLATDNGVVTAVWSKRVADPLFSDGYGYLCGRMYSANNNTRIQARVDNNTAAIQAVVGGTATSIGSTATVACTDGDVWEFWYGTLTQPYVFWLKQNGQTVLEVEDTGHISQRGTDYRMCGVGGRADNYAAIFQIAPPVLNGWTWRDQNLTAVA